MPPQPGAGRICVDCLHHASDDEARGDAAHRCGMPQAASLVDGSPGICADQRRDVGGCGALGRWFQPRGQGVDVFADEVDRPLPAPRCWSKPSSWRST